MAAGLIGLAVGGAAGFLGQQHAQKMQQEQEHKKFLQKAYMDAAEKDPTVINNPEWVKGGKKVFGEGFDDFVTSLKPAAAATQREQKQMEDIGHVLLGLHAGTQMASGGAAPTQFNQPQQIVREAPSRMPPMSVEGPGAAQPSAPAGASPAPPAQPAAPQGMEALDAEQKQLEAAQMAIGNMKFAEPETIKSYQKVVEQHLKDIEGRRKALMEPTTAAAKKQAELDVTHKNAPTIRADAAAKSAATAGAGASARVAAENSPAARAAKVGTASALATVREQVKAKFATGKPWTPKDALEARGSALTQAQKELAQPGFLGLKSKPLEGKKVEKRASEILLSEGLDPKTGARLKDGDMIRLPDGRTLHWKSH